jgi:hypothetical protein
VTQRTVVLLVTLALASGGCGALTGRPFITWSDDAGITARVKARLLSVSLKTLSRVDVDTYDGVVYLSGIVDSADRKARMEAAASAVEGVRQVVSNLVTRESTRAASRAAADAPSALPAATMTTTIPAPLVGVVRLEGHRAYDGANRQIATVFTVPMGELGHADAERFAAAHPVVRVTVHAMGADSMLPTAHYLLVLWHVPPELPPAR